MEEEGLGGVKSRPRALLWLEHCVTRFSRQSRWQNAGAGRPEDVWFRGSWEGQDTAQLSDHERKQIKGDILGMSKIPKLTTWTYHVIREASFTARAILGFPAARVQ